MSARMTFSMLPAVIFVFLAGAGISVQAESPELFIHEASRIQAVPEINGRLDDECWQAARKWDGFMASAGKKAEIRTSFTALYDDQYFYLGIECEEPNTAGLTAKYEGRDSEVWDDDSVEIQFDPMHLHSEDECYYQIAANVKGEKLDWCQKTGWQWNPDWDIKTSVTNGAWMLEMRIPFSAFDQTQDRKPLVGAVWGFAMCRTRRAGGGFERSYFGAIYSRHRQPKLFGHLVFREFMVGGCLAEKEKAAMVFKRNPAIAKKLEGAFEKNSLKIDRLARVISRNDAGINACYRAYEAICAQYASILEQFDDLELDARYESLFQRP